MGPLLMLGVLMQVLYATCSEFRVQVSPDNNKPNCWDPQWIRPAGQAEELLFSIQNSDYESDHVVISLLPEDGYHDVYEYFIGAYNNSVTGLLLNNEEVYAISTPNITGADYQDFWIQWSSNESWLALGNGAQPGLNVLFLYVSDIPVSAKGHKLSVTGSDTVVEYFIAENQVDSLRYSWKHIAISSEHYEMFLSAENKTTKVFQLLSNGDAHICLSESPLIETCNSSASYRIHLGAQDNSVSMAYDGDALVMAAETPGVLSCVPEMKTFWLSWDDIGQQKLIAFGSGVNVGENFLFSFIPENTREILSLGFGSSNQQFSDWILIP